MPRMARALLPCLALVASLWVLADTRAPPSFADAAFNEAYTLRVDLHQRRPISPNLFGVFFEEISHAGAGGLYAEMVADRVFYLGRGELNVWQLTQAPGMTSKPPPLVALIDKNAGPSGNLTSSLRVPVDTTDGLSGVRNGGYWGMNLTAGAQYNLTVIVRVEGNVSGITAELYSAAGGTRSAPVLVPVAPDDCIAPDGTPRWVKLTAVLTARADATDGGLELRAAEPARGTLWLGVVSLFPARTFKGRPNGLREDLATMLQAMKPGFVRFPGGCYVQGVTLDTAFRWKASVGPLEERAPLYNSVWGYTTDNGLGFLEFLQLSEDLGAEPIWVVNGGIAIAEEVPTDTHEAFTGGITPHVQDVLDGIEYATGNTSTYWGALRAKHGREEPFAPLKFLAVGNEACNYPAKEYPGNYLAHFLAIKKQYPEIMLIANCDLSNQQNEVSFPNGIYPGHNFPPQPLPYPAPLPRKQVEMWDYHVYPAADWFIQNLPIFDDYPREWPSVFVSEYAAQCTPMGRGSIPNCTSGTLFNAVMEAAWMTALERNGDKVQLAAYAPLFANVHYKNWSPNAILFDQSRAFGTTSYWVQRLFSTNQGVQYVNAALHATSRDSAEVGNSAPKLTFSSTSGSELNTLIVKLVNYHNVSAYKVQIVLEDALAGRAPQILSNVHWQMISGEAGDENSFDNPEKVSIQDWSSQVLLTEASTSVQVHLPPMSVSALKLWVSPNIEL